MMRLLAPLLLLVGACAAPAPMANPIAHVAALSERAAGAIEAQRADLIAFRRDLHQHPEVSGEEARTARVIADRLEALGYNVRRNVGGHGVVATLRGARAGPMIAFRADTDAVYSNALDPVEFASLTPGVRHICGHDIHATIGIALAEGFAAIRNEMAGTVMLIFQPAEESTLGANAMIADGAFATTPAAIFALHTAPYEVGQFGVAEGVQMVARDQLEIEVRGPRAGDAMHALHARIMAINTAPPFANQPATSDFINVDAGAAQENSGEVTQFVNFNVSTATASANARNASEQAAADTRAEFPQAQIAVTYRAGHVPGVRNDVALTRRAAASMRAAMGADVVMPIANVIPAFSEDFGHFQARTPGVMFFLGVSNSARGWVGMPHTPGYVADEDSIFIGARGMMRAMLDEMAAAA